MDLLGFEVDFHWPDRLAAVEIDGPGHGRAPSRARDERLDAAPAAAGYVLLRFTDADVHQRPALVSRGVGAALAAAGDTLPRRERGTSTATR